MRHIFILISALVLTTSFTNPKIKGTSNAAYNPDYVEIASVKYRNEQFTVVYLKRDSNHVKAKYFAAADFNGNNVNKRYKKWSAGRNVILVSSGTYMDYDGIPVGLTVDNGVVVNKNLAKNYDGLVIVFANGGIAFTNLKNGDLKLKGAGIDTAKKYDLRKSAWDLQAFITWAEKNEATVFQTHLLAANNKLEVSFMNSSHAVAPRRFLAIGKDEKGKGLHVIIQSSVYASIYDGTKKSLDFLREIKNMQVDCLLNLDTGDQDVFILFEKDGSNNKMAKGERELSTAVNLLAYYYQ